MSSNESSDSRLSFDVYHFSVVYIVDMISHPEDPQKYVYYEDGGVEMVFILSKDEYTSRDYYLFLIKPDIPEMKRNNEHSEETSSRRASVKQHGDPSSAVIKDNSATYRQDRALQEKLL